MTKMFKYKKENRIYWFNETGLKVLQQHQDDSESLLIRAAEHVIDITGDRQSLIKDRGCGNLERLVDSQYDTIEPISTLIGPDVKAICQIIGLIACNPKSFHLLNATMQSFKISVNHNHIELNVPHKFVEPVFNEIKRHIACSTSVLSSHKDQIHTTIPVNDPDAPKLCLAISSESF